MLDSELWSNGLANARMCPYIYGGCRMAINFVLPDLRPSRTLEPGGKRRPGIEHVLASLRFRAALSVVGLGLLS